MNITAQFLRPFHPLLFSCLLTLFTIQLSQADIAKTETVFPLNEACLTGWFPIKNSDLNTCLETVSCSQKSSNVTENSHQPNTQINTCPTEFQQIIDSDPSVLAMIESHSGNTTHTEFISASVTEDSATWMYVWSAGNLGMTGLHIAKALSKSTLLFNGKKPYKNAIFLTTYMIGAIYHILEMPMVVTTHLLPQMAHYFVHIGMLFISIIERLYDCSCCSQYKNGHNTMIAFHILGLVFASLW